MNIKMTSTEIIKLLSSVRLPAQDEKETQKAIERIFFDNKWLFYREYRLDEKNTPDFLVATSLLPIVKGIAIEVKIKGSARKIYKQCERYCQFESVSELLLITNRSMGFPKEINGKPCYFLNIGKAWL